MKIKNKKFLVFNWKMNPTSKKKALKLFSDLKKEVIKSNKNKKKIEFIVAPPFVYLDAINIKNKDEKIKLSGQDNFYKSEGSYTGAVSQEMLKDLNVKYSIVGHWERRSIFGETDIDVSKKIKSLMNLKIKTILCVGEEKRDSDGKFAKKVEEQIKNSLNGVVVSDLKNITIAYEPVWAIGALGSNAITSELLQESTILIKKILMRLYGEESKKVKILYGGSIDADNIAHLSSVREVDGFLLGKSSLDKDIFSEIIDSL